MDKSALWKLTRSPDEGMWHDRISRGEIWACLPTVLEVAVSARSAADLVTMKAAILSPLLHAFATPRSEAIAVEMMDRLVSAGLHRSVPLPDVLIASIAAAEGLTVLHDDRDFERIAELYSGLAVERLRL